MEALGVLYAIACWGIVLGASSFLTSIVAQLGKIEDKFVLGVVVQVSNALLSVLAAAVTGSLDKLGLSLDLPLSIIAFVIAVSAGLPLAYLAARLAGDYEPSFIPEDPRERIVLALVFAPLGEELLFRGLLEGQLLGILDLWMAVAIPALLFSLVHAIPFSGSPRAFLYTLLASALLIGLLAGYLRAISGSLLPAVAVHAGFNFAGNLVDWSMDREP